MGAKGSGLPPLPPTDEQARLEQARIMEALAERYRGEVERVEQRLLQSLYVPEPPEPPVEPVKPDLHPQLDLEEGGDIAAPVETGRDIDVE